MFRRRKTGEGRAGRRVFGAAAALFLGLFLFSACRNNSVSPVLPETGNSGNEGLAVDAGGEAHQDETVGADPGNGERIYFTSTNEMGEAIPYTGGPDLGGMMMGSYLTCASCHGPTGQGGRHVMHMQVMDAPAISYSALSSEEGEHTEEEEAEHGGEYSLEIFHRAVVEGQHPDGDALGDDMPRWDIGDEDLRDLYAFLQNLP